MSARKTKSTQPPTTPPEAQPSEKQLEWKPQKAGWSSQTLRERWQRQMHFQKVDRVPSLEFGYWTETLEEWHKQGLPKEVNDEKKAYAYFGIEDWRGAWVSVGLFPHFKHEVLEEGDDYVIVRDGDGATSKQQKGRIRTIPHYISYGIQNRNDWAKYKERLDPTAPGRYPEHWAQLVKEYAQRDYPLCISIGSMIGVPRNWFGFENVALVAYDDPELLEEIIETLCTCVCNAVERALKEVRFDFGAGWEDICFKNGPILSPAMFDRWIVPRYKRITDLMHKYGVDINWTDCDGNIMPILPQFLAGGINCMFPIEVGGGSDPIEIRRLYGDKVLLHGGVNKRALQHGFKEIEEEMKRLKPLVEEGGFVPHVDHRVPADVSLENYKCYLRLKRDLLGAGDLVPYYKE